MKAVQALQRAIDIDPSHLSSWLALAISHTNNSNRTETYNAIYEWVSRNEAYQAAVQNYRAQHPDSETSSNTDKFTNLIGCIIAMARSDTSGNVDADVQIALAVLLNTNEASGSTRPDTSHLYFLTGV
jgi:peroxin-5